MKRKNRKVLESSDEEEASAEVGGDATSAVAVAASTASTTQPSWDLASVFGTIVQQNRFCFATTQTSILSTLFRTFQKLFDTMNIEFTETHIHAMGMNMAKTCFARWSLARDEMQEGILQPPAQRVRIVLDVTEFAQFINAYERFDAICFTLDNDSNPDKLMLHASKHGGIGGSGYITLNTPDETNNIGNVPPISYSNQVSIPSDQLSQMLHVKCTNSLMKVRFDMQKDKFVVNPLRDRACTSFHFKLENVQMNDSVCTPRTFPLAHILHIMGLTRTTPYVKISMPEKRPEGGVDKPLCMRFRLGALGTVVFFTSNSIDDEDEMDDREGDEDDEDEDEE